MDGSWPLGDGGCKSRMPVACTDAQSAAPFALLWLENWGRSGCNQPRAGWRARTRTHTLLAFHPHLALRPRPRPGPLCRRTGQAGQAGQAGQRCMRPSGAAPARPRPQSPCRYRYTLPRCIHTNVRTYIHSVTLAVQLLAANCYPGGAPPTPAPNGGSQPRPRPRRVSRRGGPPSTARSPQPAARSPFTHSPIHHSLPTRQQSVQTWRIPKNSACAGDEATSDAVASDRRNPSGLAVGTT